MSHIYTSLAYALKQNELLLKECSPKFRGIVSRIERKQFSGNQREFAKELNFALKTSLKMINSHSQVNLINETMREELKFIGKHCTKILRYPSKSLSLSSSQGFQRHRYSEIAHLYLVTVTPQICFGGSYLSRMRSLLERCCI